MLETKLAAIQSGCLNEDELQEKLRRLYKKYRTHPPEFRLSIDVQLKRDIFFLDSTERKAVAGMCGLGTMALPCAALERTLLKRRFKVPSLTKPLDHLRRHNLISFLPTGEFTCRFREHPTYLFLREVVAEGKDYKDRTFYRQVAEGSIPIRRLEGDERAPLQSDTDFATYRDRCLALAESISRHGVVDIERTEGAAFRAKPEDNNLLVAIDESGAFVHYRRGRHRLAIAQRLESRPFLLRSISSQAIIF